AAPTDVIPIEDWTVAVEVNLRAARFKRLGVENVLGTVRLQDGALDLSELTFDSCGGKWTTALWDIDLRPENRGDFSFEGTLAGADLAAFSEAFAINPGAPRQSQGTLQLNAQIRSNLLSRQRLLKEIDGRIEVQAAHGTLEGLKTLSHV